MNIPRIAFYTLGIVLISIQQFITFGTYHNNHPLSRCIISAPGAGGNERRTTL